MLDQLKADFPEFVSKLNLGGDADPEEVLPGLSLEDMVAEEKRLGIPLPTSYKRFLQITRGFWLFGGVVQFSPHPFFHHFPKLDELSPTQRRRVEIEGRGWPPPSEGMLCFAEYFRDGDGDQVLFDVSKGLINDEYPVIYYKCKPPPPFVEKLSDSFEEWLNEKCIDQMT